MRLLLDKRSSEQAQGMYGSAAHVTYTQCCVTVSEQNTTALIQRMHQPERCCIHKRLLMRLAAKQERKARAGGTSSVSSLPAAALALSLPLALVEAI